ncbi:LysR family transcriptional regulator [Paraliomyxa miuraensis]|uniref:LysR family transcriptional regulator n=1 Tax=Paraliomyxa miuraensis TaxID=376150 RepID=UPI00224CF49F|nr:LysR family transcriptional regulator [Paraliomyxa miuraensis]MCX4246012.1 LysR family transcriptional regulator [Paraliomyxa miuraensis]
MDRLDWNQLRAFLETAEAGSLSAAARKLGLTQPTLSRQVAAVEQRLGVTLFERVGKAMVLTSTGLDLLEHARIMGSAAEELALAATGRSQAVEGLVSISASDAVAAYLLPRVIHHIRRAAPRIVVEVVSSNALSDLRRREADIAIRHVSPSEPDLIARLIREATASFYASEAWVAEHGHPHTADEAMAHDFIGSDRSDRFLEYLRGHGLPLTTDHFPLYSENSVTAWELVRQGLGIGAMMDDVARLTPGVVRVLEALAPVRFPVWLVTHRELRTARRIRVVFDLLAEHLATPRAQNLPGSSV